MRKAQRVENEEHSIHGQMVHWEQENAMKGIIMLLSMNITERWIEQKCNECPGDEIVSPPVIMKKNEKEREQNKAEKDWASGQRVE